MTEHNYLLQLQQLITASEPVGRHIDRGLRIFLLYGLSIYYKMIDFMVFFVAVLRIT